MTTNTRNVSSASIAGVPEESVPPVSYAKGNYFALSRRPGFRHLVYPVPEPGGLGVHLTLDIGGGLPVNYASDAQSPAYAEYARLLAQTVPGLFDGRYGLVTEFGRSLLAKQGVLMARDLAGSGWVAGRPVLVTGASGDIGEA